MNIIDKIAISPSAVERWIKIADEAVKKIASDTNPAQIPDEQIQEQKDGSLLMFVDLPGKKISMKVYPDEWSWMN